MTAAPVIVASDLGRTYRVPVREAGIRAAVGSLIHRRSRPVVAVALRALEAGSGRIVWTGGLERDGWYRQRPFRRGRVRTRAGLLERLLRRLVEDRGGSLGEIAAEEAVR